MERTLQNIHAKNPIPPIAPIAPVRATHAAHQRANTSTQPLLDSACTSTNMRNANGRSGSGSRDAIVVTVGNVVHSAWTRTAPQSYSVSGGVGLDERVDGFDSTVLGAGVACCEAWLDSCAPRTLTSSASAGVACPSAAPSAPSCPRLSSVSGNSPDGARWLARLSAGWDCVGSGLARAIQSCTPSRRSMTSAGGTVTSQTGTPTVLVPTRTASVASRRMLPKSAPCGSTSVPDAAALASRVSSSSPSVVGMSPRLRKRPYTSTG